MLVERCKTEVAELHQFFEQWFRGELPATDAGMARFDAVTAPDMHLVGPFGGLVDHAQVRAHIVAGHGRDPSRRIWTRAVQVLRREAPLTICTYQEWQLRPEGLRGLQSTVVFEDAPDAPNGLRWLHVHETLMPEDAEMPAS